jgi:hypothetical protein
MIYCSTNNSRNDGRAAHLKDGGRFAANLQ